MSLTFLTGLLEVPAKEILDTTGKTSIEKGIIEKFNEISNTPADQLLGNIVDKIIVFGLKLLLALLIYIAGAWLIKLLRRFLTRVFERRKTDNAIVSFTLSLVTAAAWVVVIIMAIGTLGFETTSLAALLAAGGMAIGMALSGTVQNFAGGIMILIFKPFRAGDYIEAQGFAGTVSEVNITSTKLITVDNRVIILPNGSLSSGTINNYSKQEYRRVDFNISLEYGVDADAVKKLLLELAHEDARCLSPADGAPADAFAGLSCLAASSVDFTLRIWVKSEDYWPVFFDFNEKIYRELPAKGFNFPFPQLVVTMAGRDKNSNAV